MSGHDRESRPEMWNIKVVRKQTSFSSIQDDGDFQCNNDAFICNTNGLVNANSFRHAARAQAFPANPAFQNQCWRRRWLGRRYWIASSQAQVNWRNRYSLVSGGCIDTRNESRASLLFTNGTHRASDAAIYSEEIGYSYLLVDVVDCLTVEELAKRVIFNPNGLVNLDLSQPKQLLGSLYLLLRSASGSTPATKSRS
ncbi:hypothetical protein BDZ45DRAFT_698302 [Acephala macrosclerotiorum]|nr:hypothetical protein BDZ45DRAFT_698302 [Acephala macrosclerotiorum]